ncbi:MAG: EamA family transporter RarD [Leucobacter sp.]
MRVGLGYGIAAYLIWGSFPLYFGLMGAASPLEVVPWRVVTTFLFCLVLLTVLRRWRVFLAIVSRPRLLGWLAASSLLIYVNWQIFVIGVMTGHVIETALGYFINPLFTIVLGVFVWRERLTRLQWIAVTIAAIGVVISAVAYGSFPWISLSIALSFGLYGAARKKLGNSIDGVTGLVAETLIALPLGIAQLVAVAAVSGLTAFSYGPGITVLVLLSGVMTGLPLIFFGEAARRLPLSYIGFLQFLTPTLGFLYGYLVVHEQMSYGRWIGFAGVWIALLILTADTIRSQTRGNAVGD